MEVLDTKPLSQLVTEVTIKVCWVDDNAPNRNHTLISKEIGKEIAATLPGAPVVGFYKEEEGDFQQHSVKITIEDNSVKFETLTKPYGFVAPEKQPWYQKFLEDGVERTYLMCKAYLWTTQYPEAKLIPGKGQSMELNPDTVDGYYDGDVFVFTSATLDRLCILGDSFEPCFEGAKVATSFAKLYTDFALEVQKIIGGRYSIMDGKLTVEDVAPTEQFTEVETTEEVVNEETVVETEEVAEVVEEATEIESETVSEVGESTEEATTFTAEEQEVVEETTVENVEEGSSEEVVSETVETVETVENAEPTDFTIQLNTLNERIKQLEQELEQYKLKEAAEENMKKEQMLEKYRKVLSAEEISPVEEKIAEYSLDDVEAKLAIIFSRKQFSAEETANVQFGLNDLNVISEDEDLPSFMQQALELEQSRQF